MSRRRLATMTAYFQQHTRQPSTLGLFSFLFLLPLLIHASDKTDLRPSGIKITTNLASNGHESRTGQGGGRVFRREIQAHPGLPTDLLAASDYTLSRRSLVKYYLDLSSISRCYDLQKDALSTGSLSLPQPQATIQFRLPGKTSSFKAEGRKEGSREEAIS
ncbi:hypothetical protein MGYG_08100 [Nannizzia gypsea CBS 118893]|uniref:Uncharacterized protein n=1 Tax=Arthroderma gypseum (strain ATCC MYA-4604 / CBS 118893) TaxID=535722 RepID=E4V517_ARTGP|nr:hypothetical protein MGYG_08100 [Nannizzia gypsea CBS 118893]EFR05091.1 hypothetical protein MGYG_08100 [Nannizzia gypsea CBS 118893]